MVRIDLDELSLRTVQGESLSSNSGFGIAVDHKASAASDFVRSADVHVGSSESRVTREMGGIAASSGVIEVRDLELIGSVIIKKPASLEELGVEAPSRREESVEDSVESSRFGAGFSSPAAGSSFGAEVRVSASGVDMSRVVGAGTVLGGSFEVGSEGFVGSGYDLEVSWADVVDRAALEEAWSGGVSDISGRVAESVAVASRDVVDAGTKLVQIGSSVLELPADIVDALIGTKHREDGVEESKGVEAEDELNLFSRYPEILEEDLDEEEKNKLSKIIALIERELEAREVIISDVEKEKIVKLALSLSEEVAQRPEIVGLDVRGVEGVASGGPLIAGLAIIELVELALGAGIIKLATDAAVEYVVEGDSEKLESLSGAIESYDNRRIEEARKRDEQPGSKFKDSAISGMPDPDDDEGEEFDPSKEGNYDKLSRHERFGKFYRDAKDNRIWYSKERSGDRAHGGEHWKKFVEKPRYLEHIADVDLEGNIMNKHKSLVGIKISKKELIGIK